LNLAPPQASGISPSLNVRPCANTFSLGVATAVDVRPTVALVAEAIPTLVNGTDLGIYRPAYAFGIQKKIWRHAFTFGFSTARGPLFRNGPALARLIWAIRPLTSLQECL